MEEFIRRLIQHGGHLTLPYKEDIEHYYGEGSKLGWVDGKYVVGNWNEGYEEYSTLEEALEDLGNRFDNIGAVQSYVMRRDDLDDDWELIKKATLEELERRNK